MKSGNVKGSSSDLYLKIPLIQGNKKIQNKYTCIMYTTKEKRG